MSDEQHPSSSSAQVRAEQLVLPIVSEKLGVPLQPGKVTYEDAVMQPDGMAADHSVFVEIFAHVGKLKGGQFHKVSTDTLKLVALRDRFPEAKVILVFVDQVAADAVVGWRNAVLEHYGIEKLVIALQPAEKEVISETQVTQKMVNAPRDPDDDA